MEGTQTYMDMINPNPLGSYFPDEEGDKVSKIKSLECQMILNCHLTVNALLDPTMQFPSRKTEEWHSDEHPLVY
jgi:hypothetical protein